MARKSGSTIVQDELYPLHEARERELFDEARLIDLEAEQESPFLRAQKRVSVRRSPLPPKTASYLKWIGLALIVCAIFATAAAAVYRYGERSWRFRIESSDQIEIVGSEHVTHAQIMEVMGGDIGRNIFFVPLAQRKLQLEQIPWVESASIMRFVPNRLRVEIHERAPVAFARIGSHISLIDAGGNLMELTPGGKQKYSFPVIAGMNSGEPLSTRAARMKNYNELIRQLDSDGAQYSKGLSEVDLTDPENVKIAATDPNGEVLVHLGSGNYLQRYRTYISHVQQWRQQFDKLESVDLRYDGQIIVNPDLQGIAHQPVLTPAAAKAAMAAGVKSAAIVNYEKYFAHPAPPVPVKKPAKPAHKGASKTTVRHGTVKPKAAPVSSVASKTIGPMPQVQLTGFSKTAKPDSDKTSKPPSALPVPAAVAPGKGKPSPAIPKEPSQN